MSKNNQEISDKEVLIRFTIVVLFLIIIFIWLLISVIS